VVQAQDDSLHEVQQDEYLPETASLSPEYPPRPEYSPGPEPEEKPVAVRETSFRAKDGIFSGKTVRGSPIPTTRDQSLLHTNLTKKSHVKPIISDETPAGYETGTESASSGKQDKKTKKHDDISWI
jgi:hypothetical protein